MVTGDWDDIRLASDRPDDYYGFPAGTRAWMAYEAKQARRADDARAIAEGIDLAADDGEGGITFEPASIDLWVAFEEGAEAIDPWPCLCETCSPELHGYDDDYYNDYYDPTEIWGEVASNTETVRI